MHASSPASSSNIDHQNNTETLAKFEVKQYIDNILKIFYQF